MSTAEEFVDLAEAEKLRANGKPNGGSRRASRGHRFFQASDLAGLPVPERESLVRGLVPMSTVTLLGGDGGTGKSLLALQLAWSVTLGRSWLNLAVKPGRAIFVTAEDDKDELHRRLADIARAEGVGLEELHRLTVCSLLGEDALLATLDSRTATLHGTDLLLQIDAIMRETEPVLLVLDTLADMFPGNENDRSLARQFIGILRGPAAKYGTAIVVLAHPSLTGMNSGTGTSGSTGWSNSVRSRLYFERIVQDGMEPDTDARRLTVKKANYDRIGTEIMMRWRDGVFVAETPLTGIDRIAVGSKAERVFLLLLDRMTQEGRYVSAQPGPTFAPAIFAKHPDSEGVTKRGFGAAMDALFSQSKIRIEHHGTGTRARSHISICTHTNGQLEEEER